MVAAAGLATLAGSLYIAARAYTPVWFMDEWELPITLTHFHGHYPLSQFWAQHNNHRVPFIKALQLLDLFALKGAHWPLLVLNWLIQAAMWSTLMYFVCHPRRFNPEETLTLAGITAFFVFNPNEMKNFEWAFQAALLASFLFAAVAIGASGRVSESWNQKNGPRRNWRWFFVAIAAAFISECNLASGVFTWIMMPVCAALRRCRRAALLFAAVAVPGIVTYFIGYYSPSNVSNPVDSARHPALVVLYVEGYFAESWHFIGPRIGIAFALVALVALIYLFAQWIRRGKPVGAAEAFTLTLIVFILSTAIITALGRQEYGIAQAREGRYQTAAMLFWWALLVLLLASVPAGWRYRVASLLSIQIFLLVIFVREAARFHELLERALLDVYTRNSAALAVEAGIYDRDQIHNLYLWPSGVQPAWQYLVGKGLMTPAFPEFGNTGRNVNVVYSVLPDRCTGFADLVRVVAIRPAERAWFATGWAFFSARREPFRRFVATTPAGTIVGVGVGGGDRSDVLHVVPAVNTENTGWQLYARTESAVKSFSLYGIVPGTNQACLITANHEIPPTAAVHPVREAELPALASVKDVLAGYVSRVNDTDLTAAGSPRNPVRVDSSDPIMIEGWVSSGDHQSAMNEVYAVYARGATLAEIVPRPDVAAHFNNGALLMTGYQIAIPPGTLNHGLQTIRILGHREKNDRFYQLPAVLYLYCE